MMNRTILILGLVLVLTVALGTAGTASPKEESIKQVAGAVYTMTNNATGNQVVHYDRAANGTLSFSGTFPTNGMGTGTSLGDQGGVVLSKDGRMLLVVNAGSNEISAFRVEPNSLTLTDKVNSGGIMPVSIAVHGDLVYVVNAGVPGNIVGYRLSARGNLSMIPGSTQPLSNESESVGPAEISFNPDGNVLVVTEKSTNIIDTYTVDDNGTAHGPTSHASNGVTPFGFAFDKRGLLIVSEAATNALSSYTVGEDSNLETISASIPDFHAAPCWVVVTKDGKFTYTNNAHDGTTSSYAIAANGTLSLLNPVAASPGVGNIDLALSKNSRFLYSLNSGPNTIAGFEVNPDGNLTSVGNVSVPSGADGLAAR